MDAPAHPRPARARHWEILWLSVAVLALAAVLRVRDDGRVVIPGFAGRPLPHACASQRWLNVKCPGCGLTRSFIHLAHGRWHEAASFHRLGWLAFVAAAAQVPYRLARIYRPDATKWLATFGKGFAWTTVALLLLNWVVELIAGRLA